MIIVWKYIRQNAEIALLKMKSLQSTFEPIGLEEPLLSYN